MEKHAFKSPQILSFSVIFQLLVSSLIPLQSTHWLQDPRARPLSTHLFGSLEHKHPQCPSLSPHPSIQASSDCYQKTIRIFSATRRCNSLRNAIHLGNKGSSRRIHQELLKIIFLASGWPSKPITSPVLEELFSPSYLPFISLLSLHHTALCLLFPVCPPTAPLHSKSFCQDFWKSDFKFNTFFYIFKLFNKSSLCLLCLHFTFST